MPDPAGIGSLGHTTLYNLHASQSVLPPLVHMQWQVDSGGKTEWGQMCRWYHAVWLQLPNLRGCT